MINKLIIDTLKPINTPVSFQKYLGKAKTYFTFHEYLETAEEFEDDTSEVTYDVPSKLEVYLIQ